MARDLPPKLGRNWWVGVIVAHSNLLVHKLFYIGLSWPSLMCTYDMIIANLQAYGYGPQQMATTIREQIDLSTQTHRWRIGSNPSFRLQIIGHGCMPWFNIIQVEGYLIGETSMLNDKYHLVKRTAQTCFWYANPYMFRGSIITLQWVSKWWIVCILVFNLLFEV